MMEMAEGTPPFFFMIEQMRPDPTHRPNPRQRPSAVEANVWYPPRTVRGNHKRQGRTTGIVFKFDGSRVTQPHVMEVFNSQLQSYGDMSIYHDAGRFWAVPYDATVMSAAQAREAQQDTGDSDSDEDLSLGHNWAPLRLCYPPEADMLSYLMCNGEHPRLAVQRVDQRWVWTLFPNTFHSTIRISEDLMRQNPQYMLAGGMTGEIAALLGLIAFSVPADEVLQAVVASLRPTLPWSSPVLSNQSIGRGWTDKRGVVIRTFTSPMLAGSTREALDAFERGVRGKIFDGQATL